MRYLLAITSITEIIKKREATQEGQSALHKIETYLLLYLMQIIGRRSSSPAAAHDCDLYFSKREYKLETIISYGKDADYMKLIAKTQKGTEYLHSKQNAFFAPDSSANKICKVMNDVKFRLQNDTEIWHVYDYDITQDLYVTGRLTIYRGQVKLKAL